jgi:hypothetical protein
MRRPKEITLDKKIEGIESFMLNLTDSQLSYFNQRLIGLIGKVGRER